MQTNRMLTFCILCSDVLHDSVCHYFQDWAYFLGLFSILIVSAIYGFLQLRHIKDNFNVSGEILWSCACWTIFGIIYFALLIICKTSGWSWEDMSSKFPIDLILLFMQVLIHLRSFAAPLLSARRNIEGIGGSGSVYQLDEDDEIELRAVEYRSHTSMASNMSISNASKGNTEAIKINAS